MRWRSWLWRSNNLLSCSYAEMSHVKIKNTVQRVSSGIGKPHHHASSVQLPNVREMCCLLDYLYMPHGATQSPALQQIVVL